MSLRENWQAAQELDHQQAEADGAGHRRYAKAWELYKLGGTAAAAAGRR
jgi:hypothetical protein